MGFKRNLKCPVCGNPMVQNPGNNARYTCENGECSLIEVWFRRLTFDSSLAWKEKEVTKLPEKVVCASQPLNTELEKQETR